MCLWTESLSTHWELVVIERTVPAAARRAPLGWGVIVVVAVAAAFNLTTVACQPAAPEPHDAAVVGVVASREFPAGGIVRFVLTSGQTVEIDQDVVRSLNGAGTADVGDLLFVGDQPMRWYVTMPRRGVGDFEVRSQPDRTGQGSITFDYGLRLKKAPTYLEDEAAGQMEPGAPVLYLVNDKGEVTARK
jgi:hypothetical protein